MQEILGCLPLPLRQELAPYRDSVEEIHLRLGRRSELVAGRRSILLGYRAGAEDFRILLDTTTGYALYAAQASLREGYCTTRDGCRIGITGTVVRGDARIDAIREISSLCIRIARPRHGCADRAAEFLRQHPDSTLICGVPGSGKTTLLRDLIRQMSDRLGARVAVADERFEIGAAAQGIPRMDVGQRTDVLSGGKKEESMMILLRTMSPQWIAVDEISSAEDVRAVERCAYCGVRLLATAHIDTPDDLRRRPVYRAMLARRIFRNLILLDRQGDYTITRMEDGDA